MSVLQDLFFPFVFFCGALNKMNECTDAFDNQPTCKTILLILLTGRLIVMSKKTSEVMQKPKHCKVTYTLDAGVQSQRFLLISHHKRRIHS